MIVYCHKCGIKNTDRSTCSNCGVKLLIDQNNDGIPEYVQEAVQVECPWCKTVNRVIDETNCKNCGGPLPAVSHDNSGIDRGTPPPSVPRKLPDIYIKKLKYRSTMFIIGIVFIVPFIWSVIFPIIGFFLVRSALKTANRKIAALENGIKAEGDLVDIYKDTSESVNERHPWRLDYEFKTRNGELITAKKTGAWSNNNRHRRIGDKLWVVYLRDNPNINAIWPPVD